ncbi:chitin deacetylase [Polynucleobacter sp. SHI8]|uniref:polysaccharide deacetylase family protein n=1 Tax=unclassified Polynucleobacter TaxID=2640945 RepID=UPI002493AFBE|nr:MULTISPECIES: polysaccharide deacetylase family protein [unclassified Polynucleobacter]BDW10346.1 chitin deacetylase [Polynucleobacter sp. SHI2]BDW12792.1 chitin deacetylase [Polynucleobacter sp. SHI8]
MQSVDWVWPKNKKIAVVFNVCLEAWSDGKAPGISPMGNPLPAGYLDNMAISWASYGPKKGIYRILDSFAKYGAKSSMMVNGIIAERHPEAVKATAQGGHEILSHSYAMDVIPVMLTEDEEKKNIERCTQLLSNAAGAPIKGWLSPRGTPSAHSAKFLAQAGYTWHGDVFDSDLPYIQEFDGKKIVAIPLGTDVNDMPFMKFGNPPELMLQSFMQNLDIAREQDEVCIIDVTSHAHIFGRPRGAYFYEKIIQAATSAEDVWVGTRLEIAQHILSKK